MIVSRRIEFMSGVFRDGGVSTGMEPGRTDKEGKKKMSASRLTERCSYKCLQPLVRIHAKRRTANLVRFQLSTETVNQPLPHPAPKKVFFLRTSLRVSGREA